MRGANVCWSGEMARDFMMEKKENEGWNGGCRE